MLLSVCINGTISNKAILNLSHSLAFVPCGASGRSLLATKGGLISTVRQMSADLRPCFKSVPPSRFGTSEARAGQPLPPGDADFYLLLDEGVQPQRSGGLLDLQGMSLQKTTWEQN